MKKASVVILAATVAMLGLVACGGDDDDGGDDTTTAVETTATEPAAGGAGGTIDISAAADGTLAYDQTSVETTAGANTLNFDNPAALSHDVVIEDEGGSEVGATDIISESTASTSVDLQAGAYTFFCSVPGHREGGMEGPLTVN